MYVTVGTWCAKFHISRPIGLGSAWSDSKPENYHALFKSLYGRFLQNPFAGLMKITLGPSIQNFIFINLLV